MDIVQDDLFKNTSGIILHGCNCSGGFGSGVAGIIAKMYPEAQHEFFLKMDGYTYHRPNKEALGTIQPVKIYDDFYIVNGFTQLQYGGGGKRYASPDAIHKVLLATVIFATEKNLDVHVPKIGCGLGGIKWEEVEPYFVQAHKMLEAVGLKLTVYYI